MLNDELEINFTPHSWLTDCCHDEEMNALLIKKLPEVLLMTDKMDFHVEAISSLFKFLLGLLSKEKFKEFVLNSLYQGFFQQFLDKISNYKGVSLSFHGLLKNLSTKPHFRPKCILCQRQNSQ